MVEDGKSSFIADLTNEADLFGTDSDGKTIGVQVRSTKMHLILGTTKQTLTANPTVSLTYASNGNAVPTTVAQATSLSGKDTTEGSVSVTIKEAQTVTDSIYVDITSTCSTGSLTKRFTLKPVKSGEAGKSPELWQLSPDVDDFSFSRNDDATLSPSSLTLHAYVEKTVGNDVTRYTSAQDGWRVYWGYDESGAEGYVSIGGAITLTNTNALSHRLIWLELRKSSDSYSGWVDRETVPINKDGKKGAEGDTGNGIESITLYRMYTAAFSAPAASDSGWIVETNSSYPTPEGLSKDSNRYFLWQKKVTTYTKTSDVTNEISLVAQLNTGICANLLEDTAFNSIGEMDAWMTKSQYEPSSLSPESGAGVVSAAAGPNGMNAYYDKTAYGSSELTYKEVLQQKIWEYTSQGFKKLEYNKWYTFSFWVKGSAYTKLNTYIYPSCVNQSADFFVDGVKQDTVPVDGCVSWSCSTSWVRHTVTFKTKSSFYNSGYVDQYILFRLLPQGSSSNYAYICMPKLEQNYMATEWIEHTNDRKADDFQHIYAGEWAAGTTYHYDNGVRHVVRALESASGSKVYFRLKKRTTSAGLTSYTQPYNDSTNWEKANHLKFVATDFLLADEAVINFAKTNRILVNNSSGTVAAGMGGAEGGDSDYPLWVGANYAQRGNAPFRVTLTGKLFATEANIVGKIEGSVRNPFMLVGDSFSTYDKDNLIMMTSGGGWTNVFSLPWTTNQAGRIIRILSYKWNANTSPASGWGSIAAPSGKYFYEGGKQYSTLYFSREIIELIGYGTPTTFYGWIVMRRIDLMTERTYGLEQKALCYGRIHGNQSGGSVSFYKYKTCDKSALSVSRTSEGLYKITIPTSWKVTEAELLVFATPVGYIYNGSNMMFCSVESIETNSSGYVQYVSLQCSDDQSRNDGDIFFAMYNMSDWTYLSGE